MPEGARLSHNDSRIRCWLPGTAPSVRAMLGQLMPRLATLLPNPEDLGLAELVLAEVLNNIVEHAYQGTTGGIEIEVVAEPDGVRIAVCDRGQPFPGDRLPSGRLAYVSPADALPEGGFGWHLIRHLSRDLAYERHLGQNRLSFLLPADQSRQMGAIGHV